MAEAIVQVNEWICSSKQTRLITFANVHMVVEAQLHYPFRRLLNKMDLNCPDGAPIFWIIRRRHLVRQIEKVSGPDFMLLFCEQSVALAHRHFLYGGAQGVAESAIDELKRRYPKIQIAGHYSPPFRSLNDAEVMDITNLINASRADVVWVCLGCPKQEQWISDMRHLLDAKVLLAVGQAIDIISGRTKRAPRKLSAYGGEWIYRLVQEPRRLWKRYLVTNLLFFMLLLRQRLAINTLLLRRRRSTKR
jgi:N-acetylglucosaminyldiphosphoundecaprenol N-acetyl-beta-D-mannosaminyltransferase